MLINTSWRVNSTLMMMSTCRWCTPVTLGAGDLLQKYCSGLLSAEEKQAVNEDLTFCLDCVVEYHKARVALPSLHTRLWELEVSRLSARFCQVFELENDDLFIVEYDQETRVSAAETESLLRVPLTEILKYPYLLAHPKINELCVEALCKMEKSYPFQVYDKHQGIYLLLVHPNEMVRRWAIRAARSLGKVDRDDFYDLQDIFCSMFRVLSLDLFNNSEINSSCAPENDKLVLLPRHLYDAVNYKNYWLGICMLLTQLDAQAMDSLLLGPEKQTDIIQCILNTMEKEEDEGADPFWPSLQCFMVILDRLGSKIWGQLIEPAPAFQTITGSPSYTTEIGKIRQLTSLSKVKTEFPSDDLATCSQMIYDCNIKEKKGTRVRCSSTENSGIIFEEMQSLVNVLQSEMGQDMRVHDSTFLWFIPFVQSVMDLNELGIVYIGEIIHYLCGEIKDHIKGPVRACDKVTEFFTLILVFIIELHLNKNQMNILYYSAPKWVEIIVQCATLPYTAFSHGLDSGSHYASSTSSLKQLSRNPQVSAIVPQACIQIIRSLLKEGGKLSSHGKSMQFLDMLNKQIREAPQKEWSLGVSEVKELQNCLKQLVKTMKDKQPTTAPGRRDDIGAVTPPMNDNYEESGFIKGCSNALKKEPMWDYGQYSPDPPENMDNNVDLKTEDEYFRVKKEPYVPKESYGEAGKELNTNLPLSTRISDPGMLQVIKSKFSPSLFCKLQVIAKKSSDSKNHKGDVGEHLPVLDKFSNENNSFTLDQEVSEGLSAATSDVERSLLGVQNRSLVKSDVRNDDDVPLSVIKSQLKKNRKLKHIDELTGDQVDKDCNRLHLPTRVKRNGSPCNSSPEKSSIIQETKSKVSNIDKNPLDHYNQDTKMTEPALDVIIISDESVEDDDEILVRKRKDQKRKNLFESEDKFIVKSELPDGFDSQKSPGHFDVDLSDSQLFEFETQEDIFSEWNVCKTPSIVQALETEKEPPAVSKLHLSPTQFDTSGSCEYDTDPVSDEKIENALLQAEEQLKNQRQSVEPKTIVKQTVFLKPKDLPIKNNGKRSPFKKKSKAEIPYKKAEKKAETKPPSIKTPFVFPSASSTPAIVPPKKDRKPVEPISTAEKLGLKKKERKAFELSQRTLVCVGKLRKYGQGVQVEQKPQKRRAKISKLISPKKLNVRGNRMLLASQDLQFFRQSRAKPQPLHSKSASEKELYKNKKTNGKQRLILQPNLVEDEDDNFILPSSQPDPAADYNNEEIEVDQRLQESVTSITEMKSENKPNSLTTVHNNDLHMSKYKFSVNDAVDVTTVPADKDLMNLTEMDSVDMEISSQAVEEDDEHSLFLTQRDPVDMEIDTDSQTSPGHSPWMHQAGNGQVPADVPQVGPVSRELATSHVQDDHLFLKPGMSPLSLKKAKPSTTKIYTPSSRSATLAKEMEKTAKPQLTVVKKKAVSPGFPARKLSHPQPEFRQPMLVKPHVPVNSCSLQLSPVGSLPQVPTYKTYSCPEAPFIKEISPMGVNHKFDQAFLIKTIIQWSYDMFCSYSQFGIRSDLCNLSLKEVANSYKSYDEYFQTFYPLLLINTFEELAKDWEKNNNLRKVVRLNLKVVGIEYSSQICNASFSACIADYEAKHQLYPKEDDLVILWLPNKKTLYSYEPQLMEPQAYFGCVTRSNFNWGGNSTLNITIQTRGNVSSVNNQLVKCELVGSLVNALREFKALYMLKNNRMLNPLLAPHITYFQPRQIVESSSTSEYNPEQVRAINCGVSIVNERTHKICLIHGPPGTGKSKTIVGLLQRLFSEGLENSTPVGSRQSKGRRLRVLLCAPSNAAIDSLLKKIIVVFKESCKNIQTPLGNCGDINLVRMGLEKTISKNLKLFSLDYQTRSRTLKAQQGHDVDINRRKEQLDQHIEDLLKECAMVEKDTSKFQLLTNQKYKLLKEREQLGRHLRENRSKKMETQTKVLHDAHIICCTLSTSGNVVLESAFRRLGHEPFNCVIVDEAGQATETETLIPMLHRCPALILVGDPEQLPPTVVSQKAKELKYDQSLMARLWKCLQCTAWKNPQIGCPITFLSQQYRMHPDICEFPSKYIYKKMLKTDGETAQKRCATSWPFQSYRLFDVMDGYEVREGDSFCNPKEVTLVMFLVKLILERQISRVGVITPYNAQKRKIQESLNREMAKEENKNIQVEVDTVDGFQGREMDCIIVSCVRASSEFGSIGFLGNRQRMNVTITRAKFSLFILGHLRTLRENEDWGALIQDACKRDTIIKTHEKDFKANALMIFKPEPALMRSLSFPPKVLNISSKVGHADEAPSLVGHKATASTSTGCAESRAGLSSGHRISERLPGSIARKGRSPPRLPVRPPASERPRDPRLDNRTKELSARSLLSWSKTFDPAPPLQQSREGKDHPLSSRFSPSTSGVARERHAVPQHKTESRQKESNRGTSSHLSRSSQGHYTRPTKRPSGSQLTTEVTAKKGKKDF